MSIFGAIVNKIFHEAPAALQPALQQVAAALSPQTEAAAAAPQQSAPAAVATAQNVDVNAILTDLAAKNGQNLDWRHSIVDLLKLLSLDSSLESRKQLAGELHYTGDTNDSATMNVWLHRQVMEKLATNGGKVPADLHA